MTEADIAQKARAALEAQTRVNLTQHPLRVEATPDGAIVLEGEVADIAVRKIALSLAAGVPGVRGVVDRLRVCAAEQRGDGAIRDSLVKFVESESEFSNCTLRTRVEGRVAVAHDAGPDCACE
ncbi:MAG TPA: BON domain-containing protein, partial [Rhodocyclaceae bacterium]|nr:BON domain-containing protein [Rhodocyclaceae bacterium]